MLDLKQLIREIHRRSLWQVLSVYVAGSWGTYQVVEMVVENTALPEMVLPLALVLLLIGLPVVVATAIVQEGVHLKHSDGEGEHAAATGGATGPDSLAPDASGSDAAGAPGVIGGRAGGSVFTWRNTVLGGLAAFALVGAIAIGWLVRVYLVGNGPAVASVDGVEMVAEAADFDTVGAGVVVGDAGAGATAGDAGAGDPDTATTQPAEGAEARSAAGEPVTASADPGPAPPPSPPASARDDGGRAAFDVSRAAAGEARSRSQALRAAETAAIPWEAAESAWVTGESSSAAGRFSDAAAEMDRATSSYSQANAETEATWRTRIASARTQLTDARSGSDPASAGYASAMRLQDEAARREGGGDLPGAFDALVEAGDLYRSAQSPVGASAEPETPAGPTAREIVTGTFAQLGQALAAEDIGAVRRVWTSLSAQQASNFESFFEQYDDLRVDYAPEWSTISESDDRIDVRVRATWRYLDDNREEEQPPFEQDFVLSRVGRSWVITGD